MSQTQLFNLNKIFLLIFYPLFITFFINCSTGEPYRLGELVPSFQKYEETKIDPQMNEETAILKVEIGMQKYDDFFLSAKKLIIKTRLALRVNSLSKSDPEFIGKNSEIKTLLKIELLTSIKDLATLIETGESISKTVKDDFQGINATKAPTALNEIKTILTELSSISKDIKQVSQFIDSEPDKLVDNKKSSTNTSEAKEVVSSDFEERIKQLLEIETRNKKFAKLLKKEIK
jgi:hypothetical protein